MQPISNRRRALLIAAIIILAQVFLFSAYLYLDQSDFLDMIRTVGVIGIAVTVVYKQIIWIVQAFASNQDDFDRFWLWHTEFIVLLFCYGFILNISEAHIVQRHYLTYSVIWFEIWFQVMVSAAFILYYTTKRRIVPGVQAWRQRRAKWQSSSMERSSIQTSKID